MRGHLVICTLLFWAIFVCVAFGQTVENSIGQRLQFIPAGSFIMGGRDVGPGGFYKHHDGYDGSDERPRHPVRLTKPFYLATTEVTVAQFQAFVAATGHKSSAEKSGAGIVGLDPHEPEKDRRAKFAFRQKPEFTWKSPGFEQQGDHPVVGVSWQDAQAFCKWLSKKESAQYRLPTEAEWEYACRAGTDSYFSWGESYDDIHQRANIGNVELEKVYPDRVLIQWIVHVDRDPGDPFVHTAPVASFPKNPWGLHDLHGNVWEWCQDRYIDTAYAKYKQPRYGQPIPRAIDPVNDETFNTDGDWRVIRGGSWFTSPLHARSAIRSYYESNDAAAYIGFRVVREASVDEIATAKAAFDAEQQAREIVEQAVGKFESERGTDLRVRFNGRPSREVTRQLKQIGGLTEVHVSSGGRMDGEAIADIAAVPTLKILHLHHSGSEVNDKHFAPLAFRTGLESLHISAYSTLTDGMLPHLAALTNLIKLQLNGEKLTDDGLKRLTGLTNLRELDIQGTQSNGEVLSVVKAQLESLSIRRLTDETAQHLNKFPKLTRLTIYESPMTERGFAAIAGLRRLRTLRLRDCPNIASSAFTALSEMHSLKELDLRDTTIGDEALRKIANLELTSLELNSGNITDDGMRHVFNILTLNRLSLGPKTKITDRGLKHLWRLNRLHNLDLYSPHITGSGFAPLAELPELYSLRLSSPALTDKAFGYLSETSKLNHLELGTALSENASNLTDSGLQLLADKPNWRNIQFNRRGTSVTNDGIAQLRAALKNTRVDIRE